MLRAVVVNAKMECALVVNAQNLYRTIYTLTTNARVYRALVIKAQKAHALFVNAQDTQYSLWFNVISTVLYILKVYILIHLYIGPLIHNLFFEMTVTTTKLS